MSYTSHLLKRTREQLSPRNNVQEVPQSQAYFGLHWVMNISWPGNTASPPVVTASPRWSPNHYLSAERRWGDQPIAWNFGIKHLGRRHVELPPLSRHWQVFHCAYKSWATIPYVILFYFYANYAVKTSSPYKSCRRMMPKAEFEW